MTDSIQPSLFASKWSIIVFVLYIVLFVNQGILVTASQEANNKYQYDVVTVVLLTEVMKLITSVILYCKDHTFRSLLLDIQANKKVLGLYFIPAFLYCFYNNLSFTNLSLFDPTTYYLLLQLRVVITAVLFQIIFKKNLSRKQWFSLLLLTVGCMVKQIDLSTNETNILKSSSISLNWSTAYIIFQASCSCLAGVYNEYILKEPGANVNIFTQNVFMYLDSIVCNMLFMIIQGTITTAFQPNALMQVFHLKVILVMINNTAIGIITSFFLKSLNSILKTFASALELMFTAVLCYILFHIPIYFNTVLSICIVLVAIFIYSQNPVTNVASNHSHKNEPLLISQV